MIKKILIPVCVGMVVASSSYAAEADVTSTLTLSGSVDPSCTFDVIPSGNIDLPTLASNVNAPSAAQTITTTCNYQHTLAISALTDLTGTSGAASGLTVPTTITSSDMGCASAVAITTGCTTSNVAGSSSSVTYDDIVFNANANTPALHLLPGSYSLSVGAVLADTTS